MEKNNDIPSDILVLGCGRMGSRIARVLASKGRLVSVWNRTSGAVDALMPYGVSPAPDLEKALQKSPLVVAVLSTYAALVDLIHSLPAGTWKGIVLLNLCSGSASEATLMGNLAEDLDFHYVDGSIWTYPEQIGLGDTVLAYAGSSDARRAVEPVMTLLGGGSIDLGDHLQNPNVMEAAFAGSFYMITYAAAAESIRLAEAHDIGVDDMEVALDAAMKLVSEGLHDLLTRKREERYEADGITVTIALNALEGYGRTTSGSGMPMKLMSTLKDMYVDLDKSGFGGMDLSVLSRNP